ncbi:MAG: ferrous iron transport protein B [Bacteroidia bacterium]|nr:MAG: ferrous iron transport protein B [Bacteroidia bacterium]
MRLSELQVGQRGRIVRVEGEGAFRKRVLEMGFVKDQVVEVVGRAPVGDPTHYRVMGYDVSLRRSESELVEIQLVEASELAHEPGVEVPDEAFGAAISHGEKIHRGTAADRKSHKQIRVALVGNPNAGKTSVFNISSGAKAKVGNYGGVTVDSATAAISHGGYYIQIVDLPGTYSLATYSPEELYVRKSLVEDDPDVIVNVVDATNLERNLYLTLQLLEAGRKVVVDLNMWDDLVARGDRLNRVMLGDLLGAPCVPTVGRSGAGMEQLWDTVVAVHENRWDKQRAILPEYGEAVSASVAKVSSILGDARVLNGQGQPFNDYELLKILERDAAQLEAIRGAGASEEVVSKLKTCADELSTKVGLDAETYITDARYAFISKLLQRTYSRSKRKVGDTKTDKLDRILINRLIGLPIFFGLMYLMFWVTFTLGGYPMEWMEAGVGMVADLCREFIPEGPLQALICDGVIGGVGGVIVFLVPIMILFFFISFFEDSGYMARAVFLMDRLMRALGLHGRSFIPMVMGFGCSVPAVMACRTIEDRKVRMSTVLVTPFMSCAARLPVYILFIGALFSDYPATVMFGLYLFGIFVAVLSAFLFRKVLFKGDESPFVMELPPYRLPSLRITLLHMWEKGAQYLKKMGTVILLASILIWFLSYFPRTSSQDASFQARLDEANATAVAMQASEGMHPDSVSATLEEEIAGIEEEWDMVRQSESYLGVLGHAVEPVLRPMGFDWRVGVSLLSGLAAKEIAVATLGVLFQVGTEEDEESEALQTKIRTAEVHSGARAGQTLFSIPVALAYLIFVLLYMPCIAAVAAVGREAGAWKWAIFTIFYTTGVAYLFSFIVYRIALAFM